MRELAAANKLYKERIAGEKRGQRAREKAVRDQAKAEERAAIDARKEQRRIEKEARDAAKALKLSQRGNCPTSKAPAVKKKTARCGVGARSHPRPATPPPARPTVTTRSGRTATKYH